MVGVRKCSLPTSSRRSTRTELFTITNAIRSSTTVVLPSVARASSLRPMAMRTRRAMTVVNRIETHGVRRPGCTLEKAVGITP